MFSSAGDECELMDLYTSGDIYARKTSKVWPIPPVLLNACLPSAPLQLKWSTPGLCVPTPSDPKQTQNISLSEGGDLPIQDPEKPLIRAGNKESIPEEGHVCHTYIRGYWSNPHPTLTC